MPPGATFTEAAAVLTAALTAVREGELPPDGFPKQLPRGFPHVADLRGVPTAVTGSLELRTGHAPYGSAGNLTMQVGTSGFGRGGLLSLVAGEAGLRGVGGDLNLSAGKGREWRSGDVHVVTPGSSTNSSGSVQLTTGDSGGDAETGSGAVAIRTGKSERGYSGSIVLEVGTAGLWGGNVSLRAGPSQQQRGGGILIRSGVGKVASGDIHLGSADVATEPITSYLEAAGSGKLVLTTGATRQGESGSIIMGTGPAIGKSGNISLSVGRCENSGGGHVDINAGDSKNGRGGDVTIRPGAARAGSAEGGNVELRAGAGRHRIRANDSFVDVFAPDVAAHAASNLALSSDVRALFALAGDRAALTLDYEHPVSRGVASAELAAMGTVAVRSKAALYQQVAAGSQEPQGAAVAGKWAAGVEVVVDESMYYAGGNVSVVAGSSRGNNGGRLTLISGAAVPMSIGATVASGQSGNVTLASGDAAGAAGSGRVVVATGDAAGVAGSIVLRPGASHDQQRSGGTVRIEGGRSLSVARGGELEMLSGSSQAGTSGNVTIGSSNARNVDTSHLKPTAQTAGTGHVTIRTGEIVNGLGGTTGDLELLTGAGLDGATGALIRLGGVFSSSGVPHQSSGGDVSIASGANQAGSGDIRIATANLVKRAAGKVDRLAAGELLLSGGNSTAGGDDAGGSVGIRGGHAMTASGSGGFTSVVAGDGGIKGGDVLIKAGRAVGDPNAQSKGGSVTLMPGSSSSGDALLHGTVSVLGADGGQRIYTSLDTVRLNTTGSEVELRGGEVVITASATTIAAELTVGGAIDASALRAFSDDRFVASHKPGFDQTATAASPASGMLAAIAAKGLRRCMFKPDVEFQSSALADVPCLSAQQVEVAVGDSVGTSGWEALVSTSTKGYKSVDYTKLVLLLVAAISESQTRQHQADAERSALGVAVAELQKTTEIEAKKTFEALETGKAMAAKVEALEKALEHESVKRNSAEAALAALEVPPPPPRAPPPAAVHAPPRPLVCPVTRLLAPRAS